MKLSEKLAEILANNNNENRKPKSKKKKKILLPTPGKISPFKLNA